MSVRTRRCRVPSRVTDSSSARWARTMSAKSKRLAALGAATPSAPLRQQVQGAGRLANALLGHARVSSGGGDARVAEQLADDVHVGALVEQVRRERVAQH